ncbi:hypothetical protein ACFLYF_04475 [Chloroflexota bacterium]
MLAGLSGQYDRAGVDFHPVKPETGEVPADYDVSVNGKNYVSLPEGINTRLKTGDEVVINIAHYDD